MSALLLNARVASTAVNTGAAATVSASITPLPNESVYVFAIAVSGAAFTDTTTISGCGLTWAKVASVISGNNIGILYQGYGTPSAGAVTITFSRTPTSGRYQITGLTDGQASASGVAASQSTSGTGTSGSMTLTSSGIGQRLVSFWAHLAAEGTTPDSTGATWAEFSDAATTYGMECQSLDQWPLDTTHTASWATSSFYFGAMVQALPFAYTLAKKTDAPVVMTTPRITVIDEDADVFAIIG